jgi:hypothetical protein
MGEETRGVEEARGNFWLITEGGVRMGAASYLYRRAWGRATRVRENYVSATAGFL